jgi:hypothetical protein
MGLEPFSEIQVGEGGVLDQVGMIWRCPRYAKGQFDRLGAVEKCCH